MLSRIWGNIAINAMEVLLSTMPECVKASDAVAYFPEVWFVNEYHSVTFTAYDTLLLPLALSLSTRRSSLKETLWSGPAAAVPNLKGNLSEEIISRQGRACLAIPSSSSTSSYIIPICIGLQVGKVEFVLMLWTGYNIAG